MGTSKGYIAPSTPHWANVKKDITAYISNSTDNSKKRTASSFAKAISDSQIYSGNITKNFASFIGFAVKSKHNGFQNALKEIDREDILGLSTQEALSNLIFHFANEGSTIDDNISIDCISAALEVLGVDNIEEIDNIDINQLIEELVCQYAKYKFVQMFDKHIRNKCTNPINADSKIAEMQSYIYYTMKSVLTDNVINEIDPYNLSDESVVLNVLNKGFKLMEELW